MERVYLRDYKEEDQPFLAAMLQDSEVMRYIGNGSVKEEGEATRLINRILETYKENPNLGLKLLIRKEDEVKLGHAGIVQQMVDGKEEWEIGYWIARPHWGEGYASEVARSLKDFGFKSLKAKKLISLIQPGNLASRRVAEKLGMSVERSITFSGQDVLLYSISNHK